MRRITAYAASACLISCTKQPSMESMAASQPASPSEVPAAPWSQLHEARVYFGHQSVGGNIVEGLRGLAATAGDSALRIVHSRDRTPGDGLFEFFIGENGHPESKMKDFSTALQELD